MRLKTQARKTTRNLDLVRFLRPRNSFDRLDFLESMELGSSIGDDHEVDAFHVISGLPDDAFLLAPGNIRPDSCPRGFFVLYEYPFKIGFRWPFSPLSQAFMSTFNLAPGQLMPQFWRVIQVVERVTENWGMPPFDVTDLMTAYSFKPDRYHRYSPFPKGRKDRVLVQSTQVHDRGWKARYVFVRSSSVQEEGGWNVPGWNRLGTRKFFGVFCY